MIEISLPEFKRIIRATGNAPSGKNVTGVTTDSRTAGPGQAFFALSGEKHEGHQFIPDVLARGAVAVAGKKKFKREGVFAVDDPLKALARLAAWLRGRLKARVVAVTGSCGKTTARAVISQILSREAATVSSPKSFNNFIGMPLSLLAADLKTEFVVLELGSNHPGEILRLAEIARPDLGLVINARPVHLEGFKSIRGVAREKMSLAKGLAPDGVLMVNCRDENLKKVRLKKAGSVVCFDPKEPENVKVGRRRLSFTLDNVNFSVPLAGRHLLESLVAGIRACQRMGVSLQSAAESLKRLKVPGNRMKIRKGPAGSTVIDDTYNASPASVRAVVDYLLQCYPKKRKVLILGDMKELGPSSDELHASLAKSLENADIHYVLLSGECMHKAAQFFTVPGRKVRTYAYLGHLARAAAGLADSDTVFLVKGSRSCRLEKVVGKLCDGK